MVFSTPKERKRNKNYLHGKTPNKQKKEREMFLGFLFNSTTSMESKLTNFFGFS